MKKYTHIGLMLCLMITSAFAQNDRTDKTAVTYEELYDEPYSVNKLFIGFQPFYGEVFATNVNAGFGVEASYYLKEKFDFKAHMRKTYTSSFFDFNRDLALKNSDVDNKPEVFNYYELGATYHIKDFEQSSQTKMTLYKNSYKGNKWAARVPLHAVVPAKVRKIYGGRVGAIVWNGTADLNRVMKDQGLTNASLTNSEGVGLPETHVNGTGQTEEFRVFGNVFSSGVYLGGSMTWIRNVAVSFDKYEEGIDDGILTVYLDVMYSPSITVDPIKYAGDEYSAEPLKLSEVGARLGIDGKFNRSLSWAYGGEVGYRPTLRGSNFYALLKISFPIYGTNLDYKVESFGK